MEELTRISAGLKNSVTLLLKQRRRHLECQFVQEGRVRQVVVKCEVLAAALLEASVRGIIDGAEFLALKHTFDRFSLRVKARKLYKELSIQRPHTHVGQQNLAAA